MEHVVQGKLSQIEFLRIDELLLELLDIRDHADSSALVQVARLVDPVALVLVIQEADLI